MLWGYCRYGVIRGERGRLHNVVAFWPHWWTFVFSGRLVFSEDGKPTSKKRDTFSVVWKLGACGFGRLSRLGSVEQKENHRH